MHITPLAHPRVAQKMIFAEPPQLRLRKPIKLVMIGVPDVEQRHEIRIRMIEPAVRGVGLLACFHRTLARVLNAQARGDDQHLAHGLLGARLQNHPAHRRVHRQPRQLATERRELTRRLVRV